MCLLAAVLAHAQTPPVTGPENIYPNLQRALQLTNAQWERITSARFEHALYLTEKWSRLAQVNTEVLEIRLRPEPDIMALGVRQVEIAAICQESRERTAEHLRNLRAVLTGPQLGRLAQLEAGKGLLPSIGEAQQVGLTDTSVPDAAADPLSRWQVVPEYFPPPLPGCPAVGAGLLSGSIFEAPQARFANLSSYLQLSPAQVVQMAGLNGAFQLVLVEKSGEAARITRELESEAARPLPDPRSLGERIARLEAICRDSEQREQELQQALQRVLTTEQRNRWQELERARQLLPMIADAQELNLSARTVASATTPPQFAGIAARRIEWTASATPGSNLPGCGPPSASFGRIVSVIVPLGPRQP